MKISIATSILITCLLSLHSCYYDNEAYLYNETICADTTYTYTDRLAPIFNNNCVSCHGPGENPDLSTFTDVNTWKEEIVCRVVERNSCSLGAAMPPSGSLQVCDIQAFTLWQQNGYPQ
ncbi:MAG: c-type cytochrome [Flavobacteriales bacterium]